MQWEFTLDNIREIATMFWKSVGDARVLAFHGEMGAGKTTFIHALCDVKGVRDVVGSPTFSIINEYLFDDHGSAGSIFHIDLYRLKDAEEAVQAGVEDCLYSDHICLVEWPEKAKSIFPDQTVHVYIETAGPGTRKLRIGRN
jgi:tRNA threonylcarbamoyladenosine biosynthesis protein TsaE